MATAKKKLVIVESPSKAKTIGKYLGSTYKVMASVGHVRDLPKSKLGVEIEKDFEPDYISIRGKGDVIRELKKEAKKASRVYLATDPDREGEAISWHLAYLLGIDPEQECRIEFNEITKTKIKDAIKHPRKIHQELVDAQQARRVLDRLVGYQISPLLWRKIRRGLSAGRVQSAALKIICDREREIQRFVPEEYWNVNAEFQRGKKKFTARLMGKRGKKLTIRSEAECDAVLRELEAGAYVVKEVTEKPRTKKPYAPFTTSSLQQEASSRLGFSTRKTMQIAQQLYEGLDLGRKGGTTGLITYLRTDSVRVSEEARSAAAGYIEEHFGKEYLGHNVFSNKKKEIQDAHEAIRPANVALAPEEIEDKLTRDQYRLYKLIWTRFMASQMAPARYDSMQADIGNGPYEFRATGRKMQFPGYQKVYHYSNDKEKDTILPPLEKGEELLLSELLHEQMFTQPPSRFTEASLVKELEEKNIGRPSTYAPIVGTLSERKYVKKEKKALVPTDLGFMVTELMEEYFREIVDVDFTAKMEDRLDEVEYDGLAWKTVIRDFYGPFEKELKVADDAIEKVVMEDRPAGKDCPMCGKPMIIKSGRYGEFIACSGYPECKTTEPILKTVGVSCPECGSEIVEKRGRSGKLFYGCSGYPKCRKIYWNKPVNRKCPDCGELLTEKQTRVGEFLICGNTECGYKERVPEQPQEPKEE